MKHTRQSQRKKNICWDAAPNAERSIIVPKLAHSPPGFFQQKGTAMRSAPPTPHAPPRAFNSLDFIPIPKFKQLADSKYVTLSTFSKKGNLYEGIMTCDAVHNIVFFFLHEYFSSASNYVKASSLLRKYSIQQCDTTTWNTVTIPLENVPANHGTDGLAPNLIWKVHSVLSHLGMCRCVFTSFFFFFFFKQITLEVFQQSTHIYNCSVCVDPVRLVSVWSGFMFRPYC